MIPLKTLHDRGRLFVTMATVLSLTGVILWLNMIRQEDPRLPDYWGQITVAFPGADAMTMERLVLKPVEDALIEVDEIKIVEATAYDEMILVSVELDGRTRDFNHAWDEVRRALESATQKFPQGAHAPQLDRDMLDPDVAVLAVSGSTDLLELRNAALVIKNHLQRLPTVSRVHLVADPGEQVTITMDDPAARRIGVDPRLLADQLAVRNRIIPGGSLELGGKTVRLRPQSEFSSPDEIASTHIIMDSGASVMLSEFAEVRHGTQEPITSRMRLNGEISVGVAVTPKQNINMVTFGRDVRSVLQASTQEISPLTLREVTFQPDVTEARLNDLSRSLLSAMLIVSGVLILTMGLRMGLVVTAIIPLVVLSSLTLFAWGGGVLHQISIAAFVLALGMLVDNAIVVAENIQYRLDHGDNSVDAATGAIRELAIPLSGATATTLAAFVPMYISQGTTADFTRSIPVVIMICLSASLAFALLVTPVLARRVLRRSSSPGPSLIHQIGRRIADFSLGYSKSVIIMGLVLMGIMALLIKHVDRQFFPFADRNQFVVDLKLAEGAHLSATDQVSRVLEKALLAHDSVVRVASFMGRSAPLFYYNINLVPFSPHYAQLIVETVKVEDVDELIDFVTSTTRHQLPGVQVVTRKLEQGPPVKAPVEVRLFGMDFEALHAGALVIADLLAAIPGTRDVRDDLSPGAPTIHFHVDDASAARHGLSRADIAEVVLGRTRGHQIGELYLNDDPAPVVVRSSQGEFLDVAALESIELPATWSDLVPLGAMTRLELDWKTSAIQHRNGRRVVTVSSQLVEGTTFNQVMDKLQLQLGQAQLPPGLEIAFGGEVEGAGEANLALITTLPIGILLLFGVLLAEFNSFRRVGLVLITAPLAAVGIIPGLLLNNQPFGFMSLLGVIALVGIVVNNAIVLLETIEQRRREGLDVHAAVRDAVSLRIRPILLTTGTTVAGLLPLAFSASTLWPPLASAMISGLLASTLLTLIIFPAAYRLVFASPQLLVPS